MIDDTLREMGQLSESDAAQRDLFAHKLRILAPALFEHIRGSRSRPIAPFPVPSSITAAQASAFDNWIASGGKRPRRGAPGHYADRFKLTVDVWTQPTRGVTLTPGTATFRATGHLLTGPEILKRATTKSGIKLPKSLNQDYRAELIAAAEQMDDNALLAALYVRDGQTICYLDGTMALAARDQFESHDIERLIVVSPSGNFGLEGFTVSTSRGNALSGNCFAHARMASDPELAAGWVARLIPTTLQPSMM
jgi:hypothetical protein